jgi:hypothetical protein
MKSTGKKKRGGARTSGGATRTAKRSRKAARKGSRAKTEAAGRKKKKVPTRAAALKRRSRDEGYAVEVLVGLQKEPGGPAGLQSGDLQGLPNDQVADSESVDELLEEGNAFEAGVVAGVEDSRDKGGREVRTREVPVDDVPGEYLDKD